MPEASREEGTLDGAAPDRDAIGSFARFEASFEPGAEVVALGVDSGATLVKLCALDAGGERHFGTWRSPSTDRVLELEIGRAHV